MEETMKEPTPAAAALGKSKLRYPLRSATKLKEEKTPIAESSTSSASKRARSVPSVSRSMGVLDLPGKEKSSAKPPRRLSVPIKSGVAATAKPLGTITPISEARAKRSTNGQGKSETPLSDVSRTSSRKKFNALASSSYWLSQIKLSESAAKHTISLGFFKLALEAGCEPLQRMRDELKSYVRRHELGEVLESVKELSESYNIADNQEQVQVSETCSQIPEEGTRSSDDEVHSSSSTMGTRKLRPRSLNADAPQVTDSSKKEVLQKNATASRIRATQSKNIAKSRSVSDSAGRKPQKKPQRPNKQEGSKEKDRMKKQGQKPATEEGPVSPPVAALTPEEDKENMDAPPMEEINVTEVS
ncbi:uncharacterized protein LOC8277381 [Ricinus communis]|uniref:Uncharacterized protein n=1 Tax=Ricinus communis TaxID=3988 RepID=B9R964_RICCO|nr:uncharacterized protein LOC8277381 [Ricinus communis]EEF52141.1 conserved hypothetical protein [Ricinus communis]|eukprot:XP_002511539.1 uncharacterized protein LOC8277381 [Ricinus communis]